jgi:hypothetical protein
MSTSISDLLASSHRQAEGICFDHYNLLVFSTSRVTTDAKYDMKMVYGIKLLFIWGATLSFSKYVTSKLLDTRACLIFQLSPFGHPFKCMLGVGSVIPIRSFVRYMAMGTHLSGLSVYPIWAPFRVLLRWNYGISPILSLCRSHPFVSQVVDASFGLFAVSCANMRVKQNSSCPPQCSIKLFLIVLAE